MQYTGLQLTGVLFVVCRDLSELQADFSRLSTCLQSSCGAVCALPSSPPLPDPSPALQELTESLQHKEQELAELRVRAEAETEELRER